MSKKYILSVALFTLLLSSCVSGSSTSSGHIASPDTGNSSNSSSSSSSDIEKGDGIISIYSVNDFHGKIEADDNYFGMSALQGAILDNQYYEPSSIIISAGDMW